MMTYSQTHPWITFTIDLSKAPWDMWLLAGEAVSKCEHLAGVALGPEAAEELMKVYLAKGALATTAIEGNTLTEDEALKRVQGVLQLPPSKEYLGIEIDNIVSTSETIRTQCLHGQAGTLSPDRINELNRRVLQGLTFEEHVVPGELRNYSVGVADYRGAPATDLPHLLRRLCEWLSVPWIEPMKSYRDVDRVRLDAILKSIVAHIYLAWIHPFGDGNGRTARLVEFYLLARAGIPFPAAHLLSNHYNETRSDYYRQLSYASKSGGDILPFCMYALRGFADQLREQIEVIRSHQLQLFWQHYVHQQLGDSETGRRRRYLILDLAAIAEPVSKNKLSDVSVRVLRHYLGKNEKTLARDLDELEKLSLVKRIGDKYQANTDIVKAFLPPRAPV